MIITELPLSSAVEGFFETLNEYGMEKRKGQIEMAKEIAETIALNQSIVVEAGVGIGKSVAYLLPIVLNYFRERRQVVIATSTIALQEQLERDLVKLLQMLGVKANYEIVKGMTNYLCMKRLFDLCRINADDSVLMALAEKAREGIQSRHDVNVNNDTWNRVCIKSFGAICHNCALGSECKYMQMRRRLINKNQIVICNHNMLITHLINDRNGKGIFNNTISTVVIDEAHNIESIIRDTLTLSLNKGQIINELIKINGSIAEVSKRVVPSVVKMIEALFDFLNHDIRKQQDRNSDLSSFLFKPNKRITNLTLNIRKKLAIIEDKTPYKLNCLKFIREMDSNTNLVWLSYQKGLRINICKKDICQIVKNLLFVTGRRTVLTSATLSAFNSTSSKNPYGHFLKSIGNPLAIRISHPKESPYDYDHNTMLYISDKLPYPNANNRLLYQNAAIPEIVELLKITYGKALILFTSKDEMKAVFKKLSNMRMPYKIMIQSDDSSQVHRINRFKTDVDSVILGTGVYWEGINIEGESLSQVIIYKLPFPVPDPIIEYKLSMADDPLMEVIVPEMVIKLRQGVGRLIRSQKDTGIISILDPRISNKSVRRYKERVLASFPQKSHTESLEILSDFWNNKNERSA